MIEKKSVNFMLPSVKSIKIIEFEQQRRKIIEKEKELRTVKIKKAKLQMEKRKNTRKKNILKR